MRERASLRDHAISLSRVRPVPRRGLSRVEAAMYLGVSASKFDELVRDGRMPKPKRIDNRDLHRLDLAFDELPDEGNSWDDV
jgi:excisionase family DNA binding protein